MVMRVCQCWDDGNVDDIRLTELLRKHGARASFNLNIGLHQPKRYLNWKYQDWKEVWKLSLGELRQVYEGFLVANHGLDHIWLTRASAAEARREVIEGKERLEQLFGYAVMGYAYACGAYDEPAKTIIRTAGHLYARTTETAARVFPPQDAMAFHTSGHHQEAHFWEEYQRVKAADGVFYFWGHSYEFVSEQDWLAFEQKIARISADPQAQWVDLPELFQKGR